VGWSDPQALEHCALLRAVMPLAPEQFLKQLSESRQGSRDTVGQLPERKLFVKFHEEKVERDRGGGAQ